MGILVATFGSFVLNNYDFSVAERNMLVAEGGSRQRGYLPPDLSLPRPRNARIAIEEEYALARKRGTAEALELFIRRHPDGPLAEAARVQLQSLRGSDR